jgi:hypothetical protein
VTLRAADAEAGATDLGGETQMATTTSTTCAPTTEEVRRIVAELRPVIDECVARANRLLASAATRPEPAS